MVQRRVLQCGLCRSKEKCLKPGLKCVNRWSSSTVTQQIIQRFIAQACYEQLRSDMWSCLLNSVGENCHWSKLRSGIATPSCCCMYFFPALHAKLFTKIPVFWYRVPASRLNFWQRHWRCENQSGHTPIFFICIVCR